MAESSIDSISSSRVLVTGGLGFIGSHLVEHLMARNCDVTVITKTGYSHLHEPKVKVIHYDLATLARTNQLALEEFDYVFHLAGSAYVPFSLANPYEDFLQNAECTLLLLECLRKTSSKPKLIFPSSAAVYGNPHELPISEDSPTIPISPYGVSKLTAERYVEIYCRLHGIRATTLRFFSVYGPRQRKLVVFDIFSRLLKTPSRLELLGDGKHTRDFIHINDVVTALMLAAVSSCDDGSVFNVASGYSTSIANLASAIADTMSIAPEIVFDGNVRPGDPTFWSVDITKARTELGFDPSVSLSTGLASIKTWLLEETETYDASAFCS